MNDLLTIEDIATIHHCDVRRARVLVRFPDFPLEAPTSTPRHRLWLRAEVRAYLHRKKPARYPANALQPL